MLLLLLMLFIVAFSYCCRCWWFNEIPFWLLWDVVMNEQLFFLWWVCFIFIKFFIYFFLVVFQYLFCIYLKNEFNTNVKIFIGKRVLCVVIHWWMMIIIMKYICMFVCIYILMIVCKYMMYMNVSMNLKFLFEYNYFVCFKNVALYCCIIKSNILSIVQLMFKNF